MLKIKKIKPMFNAIVTTMDSYENDVVNTSGLIDTKRQRGTIKEYQRVVAVGDTVRSVKEGDLVCINPTRYAKTKHEKGSLKDGIIQDNMVVTYNFNVIELDGVSHLLLYDQDIDYIIEDCEEIPDPAPSQLIHPNKDIIL